jgi:hypothetical protein
MAKIEKLTEAQVEQLSVYRDLGLKMGLSTERVDFNKARERLKNLLAYHNIDMPKTVVEADGPLQAYREYIQRNPKGTWSNFISNTIFGNHDSYFLYFYKYFNDVVGLDLEKINPLIEFAEVCGWCYIDENLAILMDRPNVIKFDDRNLAHCENGPAISYCDGTEVYMWHGVRVQKNWIVDRTLTAKEALLVSNVELRRAACEILGWVNILNELKSVEIDVDDDPQIGTLLEVDIPDIGKEKFLKVLCGTGRTFAIPVPPDMNTALEAQAWTYGMTMEDFGIGPEIRT